MPFSATVGLGSASVLYAACKLIINLLLLAWREGGKNIRRETSPTSPGVFKRQQSREMVPPPGERLVRRESLDFGPADAQELDLMKKSETVQERILRKSYYSRFNEDSRSSYTVRQRRRSMTRLNEHSEFFSSSSSSSILNRNQKTSSSNSSFLSLGKSLADMGSASDILSSRYSNRGLPTSNRSSDEEDTELLRGSKGSSRL